MPKGIFKNPVERGNNISKGLINNPCYKNPERGKNISKAKRGIPNQKNRGKRNGMYKPTIIKKCLFCKKGMEGKPGVTLKRKYCSIECQHNSVKGKTLEQIYGDEKSINMRESFVKNGINMQRKQGGKPSKGELKVKKYLKDNNIKFIHQYPYKLGIADFYLSNKHLIIQCYGEYWHSKPDYIKRDKLQNSWLNDNGYKGLIILSEDINKSNNLNELLPLNLIR